MTEYTLIAGSLTLENPKVSRKTIDRAFVREHFGVDNSRLARIPELLGIAVPAMLQSNPGADLRTNLWLAMSFQKRLDWDQKNMKASLRMLRAMRLNCAKAGKLLALARPKTARQRERVALWQWAIRVLDFYAVHGPAWLKGEKPAASLAQMKPLAALTAKLLGQLYTGHTLLEEHQNRFESLEDYLQDRKVREGAVKG